MQDNEEHLESFKKWFRLINENSTSPSDDHYNASRELFDGSLPFLKRLSINKGSRILDIGCGYGFHCEWFAERSSLVTGVTDYISPSLKKSADSSGYTLNKMDMHELDFPDSSFDIVWSHHSFEHSFSPLFMLREAHRMLSDNGVLAITVPPHQDSAVSGHFTIGWHIPQLIYVLLVTGYDVTSGYFIEEGYNIRALVKKDPNSEYKGKAFIKNSLDLFPAVMAGHLLAAPRSMGGYTVGGGILEVDSFNGVVNHKSSDDKFPWKRTFRKWLAQKIRSLLR